MNITFQIRKVKRVPKGWSEYQAAWIPDEDTELALENSDSEESSKEYMDAISEENSDYSDAEDDFDTVTESELGISDQQYDNQLDLHTEKEDLERVKAAKSDVMFPDEVDTPQSTTATVRFQKYRGLESFR